MVTEIADSYYNMGEKIRPHMYLMDIAAEAFKELGIDTPVIRPVRGGTDGSRLTEMGIPTPNIFTGAHNYHSASEWVSLNQMLKATDIIINLSELIAKL